jgi:predicted enzyme related to lactoylglutathione lyase
MPARAGERLERKPKRFGPPEADEETRVIKEIAFSAYPAADVRKLHEFYTKTLGLPLGEPMEFDGVAGYAEGKVGEGYFALLLDEWLDRPKGSGAGVAFEVDDLDKMSAELRAKGIEVSEPMAFPACKLANFTDPEGNKVTLHQTTIPH